MTPTPDAPLKSDAAALHDEARARWDIGTGAGEWADEYADRLLLRLRALVEENATFRTRLIAAAKRSAYYNGHGIDASRPSPNYAGREIWWDYLEDRDRELLAATAPPEEG